MLDEDSQKEHSSSFSAEKGMHNIEIPGEMSTNDALFVRFTKIVMKQT